jgi:anti-anti-sigma factor
MPDFSEPRDDRLLHAPVEVEPRPAHERAFAAIVSLRGEHDLATAENVSQAISSVEGNVLVDLTDCTFLDSTVIGLLFAHSKDLERQGRYLEVVVPAENRTIVRTLELVRMRDVIVVHSVRPSLDAGGPIGA